MDRFEPDEAFGLLPPTLRAELIHAFRSIATNYAQNRWEPSALNGGKLCEVVYTILRGHVDGHFPPNSSKPPNMVDACRNLEQAEGFPRSVRVLIPRLLVALYEVRNNRGVGHIGGDVNPNHMDATLVLECAKWLLAELVRLFHNVDVTVATEVVESLIERTVPVVWKFADNQRVLDTTLSQSDQTLLHLYGAAGEVAEASLASWIEAKNPSAYRSRVLRRLHRARLVEFDEKRRTVRISPTGVSHVERHLLRSLAL